MNSAYHRTTCRLCNAPSPELAVPIKASPIADAYIPKERLADKQELFPLDLFLCRKCGHVQLLDVVNPEVLFRDYIYTTSISLGLVRHFQDYAEEMLRRFPCAPGSLAVDIGSNDGTLLKFFKAKGCQVLGVDPAVRIAEQATAAGIGTIPAFFTAKLAVELRGKHGAAAFVTANNVFAHSDSLPDIADGVRELLSEDGIFIFEVSYLVDIMEKMLFDTVYHEHLCYHSIKPLVSFFRRHGLELFDVQRLPTKGGSIRGYVQKTGGPRKVAPIVSELLAMEAQMGLDQPEIFRAYATNLDGVKRDLLLLLQRLKAEGKIVAGYGASATVTTLVFNFEIGGLLDFLVDDNTSRHGLFSPGHHIQVFPSEALAEKKADYCVILAWQYAEPILKKNRSFTERGARFILPMPEVRIV